MKYNELVEELREALDRASSFEEEEGSVYIFTAEVIDDISCKDRFTVKIVRTRKNQ